MRPLRQRTYTINVPPSIPLDKLYERVSEALRASQAELRLEGRRLFITIWGTDAQIKESWLRIRQAVSELWELHSLQRSGEASVDAIVKEAGRTFPPEALVEALKLRGYSAEYDRELSRIRTSAPASLVIEFARRIAEVIDELRFRVSGTAIKRVVAAVSVGLDVDVDMVIEFGLKMRVFDKDEDGKVVLREEWRRAIRKLAVMLRPHSRVGGGGEEGEAAEARREDRRARARGRGPHDSQLDSQVRGQEAPR